jgi:cytochrome c oxidase subunit 3
MFFLSETFLFGAVISTRYYILGVQRPEELNQALGLLITAVLLISSLTAYMSKSAAENGNQKSFVRNMVLTIALGLLYMFGVGYEWYEAYQQFPPHTIFGTMFFTTTGLHATHVFSGIILMIIVYFIIVYFKGRKAGAFGSSNYWGVEGAVKYWHFVDVA